MRRLFAIPLVVEIEVTESAAVNVNPGVTMTVMTIVSVSPRSSETVTVS